MMISVEGGSAVALALAYSAIFERSVAAKNIVGKRYSERYNFHKYNMSGIVILCSTDAGSVTLAINSQMICFSVRERKNHA